VEKNKVPELFASAFTFSSGGSGGRVHQATFFLFTGQHFAV
jgi:hypothetical protein